MVQIEFNEKFPSICLKCNILCGKCYKCDRWIGQTLQKWIALGEQRTLNDIRDNSHNLR